MTFHNKITQLLNSCKDKWARPEYCVKREKDHVKMYRFLATPFSNLLSHAEHLLLKISDKYKINRNITDKIVEIYIFISC